MAWGGAEHGLGTILLGVVEVDVVIHGPFLHTTGKAVVNSYQDA
jgi:hypothetical protein